MRVQASPSLPSMPSPDWESVATEDLAAAAILRDVVAQIESTASGDGADRRSGR